MYYGHYPAGTRFDRIALYSIPLIASIVMLWFLVKFSGGVGYDGKVIAYPIGFIIFFILLGVFFAFLILVEIFEAFKLKKKK